MPFEEQIVFCLKKIITINIEYCIGMCVIVQIELKCVTLHAKSHFTSFLHESIRRLSKIIFHAEFLKLRGKFLKHAFKTQQCS